MIWAGEAHAFVIGNRLLAERLGYKFVILMNKHPASFRHFTRKYSEFKVGASVGLKKNGLKKQSWKPIILLLWGGLEVAGSRDRPSRFLAPRYITSHGMSQVKCYIPPVDRPISIKTNIPIRFALGLGYLGVIHKNLVCHSRLSGEKNDLGERGKFPKSETPAKNGPP